MLSECGFDESAERIDCDTFREKDILDLLSVEKSSYAYSEMGLLLIARPLLILRQFLFRQM